MTVQDELNSLKKLHECGQSFWLDYLRRSLFTGDELERLIAEDGLCGITSNLFTLERALAMSPDYDDAIRSYLEADSHMGVELLLEKLVVEDAQLAADAFRSLYEATDGAEGYISIELPPQLTHDSVGTVSEARRLWKIIDRPNVMLKVPATQEGLKIIETLTADGINLNVTCVFSMAQYEAVAYAYVNGLEQCPDPRGVSSTASFCLSSIDRVADKALAEIGSSEALGLRGRIAVSSGKLAYQRFKALFEGERMRQLAKQGAHPLRIIWIDTSTKNPAYSDVLYVEELIGPDTASAMPTATVNAFRDHGMARLTLEEGFEEAKSDLRKLHSLGIDLDALTERLQEHNVGALVDSRRRLLITLQEKRQKLLLGQIGFRTMNLGVYQAKVDERLKRWEEAGFMRRLWQRDPTLWVSKPAPEIAHRLGWLNLPAIMQDQLEDFVTFAQRIKRDGITHVVLLGMGGSSLASEVFQNALGNKEGHPDLEVLDSTHPSAVKEVDEKLELKNTLFIVSSKSGTTIETLSLFRYFWKRVSEVAGDPGRHFVAITDPGTPLMKLGRSRGFQRVFLSPRDVGGRFSALTAFGLLPASLIGVDVQKFLDLAWIMSENNAFCMSPRDASGIVLGAALGELTSEGRDKVTFLATESFKNFPIWVEQLIAESTGKDGKGIVPVVDEPPVSPKLYGPDRVFIYFFNEDEKSEWHQQVQGIEARGHPVVRINLVDKTRISQEIFCWEVAIAAAGSILGIQPFNEPNVQLAKDLAREMMKHEAERGKLEDQIEDTIFVENEDLLILALQSLFDKPTAGNYVGIQAYLRPTTKTTEALQAIRGALLTRFKLATSIGYGPRFLHSTGQLHKGGPNNGIFIQLIDDPAEDVEVPETTFTFGTLIQAQALGDFKALKKLGRKIVRINLGKDTLGGLKHVLEAIHVIS